MITKRKLEKNISDTMVFPLMSQLHIRASHLPPNGARNHNDRNLTFTLYSATSLCDIFGLDTTTFSELFNKYPVKYKNFVDLVHRSIKAGISFDYKSFKRSKYS